MRTMDSETHTAFRNPYEKIPQPSNLKKIKEDARRPLRCCNVCNCCCYLRKQMNQHPPPVPPSTAQVEPLNNHNQNDTEELDAPPPQRPTTQQTVHVSRSRIRRECHGGSGDNLTPKITETRPKQVTLKKPKEFRSRAYMISEGVELVPLLAKRRAHPRSTSLSTTDVTKYREPGPWQDYGIQYLNDLCKQMKRKQNDSDVR